MQVKNNMETLSRQGIWQSSIPFGFYHGEDKRLKINKEESDIVKEAFDLVLEGESFSSAEDIINKRYALNWHNGYLPRKLKMPSTIGNIERNGKLYKNTNEPLMSEFEHNKQIGRASCRERGEKYGRGRGNRKKNARQRENVGH